ncbi:FG-GAP-like repeat-containing protein [Pontixanthobacter sp. CEM42]|uniref:FG-GAP-like repeat-containing protein n=1 Tax=Pontixanthobacter sp. CEM42 TaxID=2792077 RepID=UPI001ADEC20B|nr:FG-GAP-like repeat-containing protein [Pontixanthobacter sp. CEM42]
MNTLEVPSEQGMLARLLSDRRLVLAALLTAFIALYFWTQSRYPALDEKAMMGGDADMSGIAFDQVLEMLPNSSILWEVFVNSINWMYTNWKGMTFGVLFAACALTLFGLIERRGFENPFANAALGAAIGTPLGVCVNCAAPIARGLHSAGMRLETTLSALVASPTLNVIVVSMSFALLPTHMAAIKLLGALAFVIIGVPILTRILGSSGFREEALDRAHNELDDKRGWIARKLEALRPLPVPASDVDSWPKAAAWLAKTFGRNLMFIVAVTVPLMILAGVLGAIMVTVFDWNDFRRAIGAPRSEIMILITMVGIAVLGIVLPVPIAFDVILAVILVNAGWPVKYAMTLMFALGCFSIYSYMIVGRAVSWKIASGMMASLAGLAVVCGVAANYADKYVVLETHRANISYLDGFELERPVAPLMAADTVVDEPAAEPVLYSAAGADIAHSGEGAVSALVSPVMTQTYAPAVETGFERLLGPEVGIDVEPYAIGMDVLEPYLMYWAMAASDLEQDGWVDVAIARNPSVGGLQLFSNRGGRFVEVPIDLGPTADQFVGSMAFTDLNGDGLPDLLISNFMHDTNILWNVDGKFSYANRTLLPNGNAGMMGAPAFADLDDDGDLDIVAANWSLGTVGNNNDPYLMASQDRIFWNEGDGTFEAQELEGIPGESLTSLVADIDLDGRPDIAIGDDVSTADKIYLNRGDRTFELAKKSSGLIPYLTRTTMSYDMGDIDNDLRQELYSAQIAMPTTRMQDAPSFKYCEDAQLNIGSVGECYLNTRYRSEPMEFAHATYSKCDRIGDPTYRAMCAGISAIQRAGYVSDTGDCDNVAGLGEIFVRHCIRAASERFPDAKKAIEKMDYVGGIGRRNVFLQMDARDKYQDRSEELGLDRPGWSWNSRFVDLDQDGWQDVFVGSGMTYHRTTVPNAFYRNLKGKKFVRDEARFGLADGMATSSYVLADYDRDGDMDVIRASALTQPIVHRNDAPSGRAFWVRLEDSIGNRAGVGAQVVIETENGKQLREIRQSGGFATGIHPQAHFGLGNAMTVKSVQVTWRDGGKTALKGPFDANSELVVRRTR